MPDLRRRSEMDARSATITVDAPAEQVFAYLSDVENLPRWATEFARELRFQDGRHVVVNGLGEFVFTLEADEATGVIDMYAGPNDEELALFPTRVVPLPGGRSAFTFTMFRGPDMPKELFESQHASLIRELENVRAEFAGT
jgi:Polyketide cyclase / dehydrase and lipid transport